MRAVINNLLILVSIYEILQEGETLSCLSCSGVLQPWYCTTVQHCHELNNVACSVRKYRTINGEELYDIGCSTNHLCAASPQSFSLNSTHTDVDQYTCNECCEEELCNTGGCGSHAYPENRGPVCFKCNQLRDPSKCGQLEFCKTGQECHPSSAIFGKRQTSEHLCTSCCGVDFCNNKCKGRNVPDSPAVSSSQNKDIRKEFLLMYPYFEYSDKLYVLVSSESPGWIQVDIPSISRHENLTLQAGRNNFTIPRYTMNQYDGVISDKGIYMNSSVPVSVSVITDYIANRTGAEFTEGYLVSPIEKLGRNHMIICGTSKSEVTIAALHSNTTVAVQLDIGSTYVPIDGKQYTRGSIARFTMQRLETITISYQNDMTGTLINSDKDIAVTAGSYQGKDYEPMVENQPPIDMAGTSFLIPDVPVTPGYTIRIVNPEVGGNTSITVRTATDVTHYSLTHATSLSVKKSSVPVHVESIKPVLVFIQSYEQSNTPSMLLWIPHTQQYRSRYIVSNPNFVTPGYFTLSLSVIIPTSEANGVLLNGKHANPSKIDSDLYVRSVQYSVLRIPLSGNFNIISHTDPYMKFGAFVFGREQFKHDAGYVQYGFPAGIQ